MVEEDHDYAYNPKCKGWVENIPLPYYHKLIDIKTKLVAYDEMISWVNQLSRSFRVQSGQASMLIYVYKVIGVL